MQIYTVCDLTTYVKALFDGDPELVDVWVQGEASNCRPAASGHWYWTLKDEDASLRCVMWRSHAATQECLPEDGGAFLLHGSVSVYPAQGQYQLYVDHVEPVGVGDLYRQFEALKAKLEAEGLFDPERKRLLPAYPERIGIVTSTEAAALRDVCHVLARRWPSADVSVAPTLVQGDGAPEQIVAALEAIGGAGVDVVIVTRGGGSLEDLWAFNDERVARAIASCPIPVVAGVGHETDFTIADFVADMRAPTPSAAAELATPDAWELAQNVDELRERLGRQMRSQLETAVQELAHARRRLTHASPARTVAEGETALVNLGGRLQRSLVSRLRLARADLEGQRRRLAALSPPATLARGYAHVSRRRDGHPVRSTADVVAGEGIDVRVTDGGFGAVVEGQANLFPLEEDE